MRILVANKFWYRCAGLERVWNTVAARRFARLLRDFAQMTLLVAGTGPLHRSLSPQAHPDGLPGIYSVALRPARQADGG